MIQYHSSCQKGGNMGTRQLHTNERLLLQACIAKELSLQETCKRLRCSRSTVYRELHRHVKVSQRKLHGCYNCTKFLSCNKSMRYNNMCDYFDPISCRKLKRFPYVCNNCEMKNRCSLTRKYYDFEIAIKISHEKRRIHHRRISISEKDLSLINKYVVDGLRKGQSLHHIYVVNKCLHVVSERTVRRYLYSGRFQIGPSELPRYVRFNHNPAYVNNYHRPGSLRNLIGRTYVEFKQHVEENKITNVTQLDSVIGKANDEKSILTIYLTKTHFMFGILISKNNPSSVNKALFDLREKIGEETWKKGFSTILTDNGFEFSKLDEIEINENGEKVSHVFFCDPYSSFQKGGCERNHELFRYIVAKGKTFNLLTQNTVNLIFSHINSYIRNSLEEKTPFELTKEFLGIKFLNSIGIVRIKPNEVNLKFDLIK